MSKLESCIGYEFKDKSLLQQAMIHSSYVNEHGLQKSDCNERLEFLGDAILEMVSSEFIYHKYPDRPEGELSKLRASLVCETALFECAKAISLGDALLLGKGMEMGGGRSSAAITSDAFEALIAAIFLDSGLEQAKKLIYDYVLNDIEDKILFYDAKTTLQEITQKKNIRTTYTLISEEGPEHERTFFVQAMIGDTPAAIGQGHNKKQAEQQAAYQTILMIRNNTLCI